MIGKNAATWSIVAGRRGVVSWATTSAAQSVRRCHPGLPHRADAGVVVHPALNAGVVDADERREGPVRLYACLDPAAVALGGGAVGAPVEIDRLRGVGFDPVMVCKPAAKLSAFSGPSSC
jgi:hypothetical protein